MVYCTKCDTYNAENATVCVNCGATLYGTSVESRPYWRYRQAHVNITVFTREAEHSQP